LRNLAETAHRIMPLTSGMPLHSNSIRTILQMKPSILPESGVTPRCPHPWLASPRAPSPETPPCNLHLSPLLPRPSPCGLHCTPSSNAHCLWAFPWTSMPNVPGRPCSRAVAVGVQATLHETAPLDSMFVSSPKMTVTICWRVCWP